MSVVVYLYGAIVLALGLIGIVVIARPGPVPEEVVVEALKRGDHDRAVRLMLGL